MERLLSVLFFLVVPWVVHTFGPGLCEGGHLQERTLSEPYLRQLSSHLFRFLLHLCTAPKMMCPKQHTVVHPNKIGSTHWHIQCAQKPGKLPKKGPGLITCQLLHLLFRLGPSNTLSMSMRYLGRVHRRCGRRQRGLTLSGRGTAGSGN